MFLVFGFLLYVKFEDRRATVIEELSVRSILYDVFAWNLVSSKSSLMDN